MQHERDDFGFALWLTLDPRSESRLAAIMEVLARRFAGPRFLPHMTVRARIASQAAGVELLSRVALRSSGLEVSLTQLRAGEQPFEALVLLPEARQKERLSALIGAAGSDPRTHVPHVSLYYGHAEPHALLAEAGRHVHRPISVHFTWLELWRIRGDVQAWTRIERVPLARHAGTLH